MESYNTAQIICVLGVLFFTLIGWLQKFVKIGYGKHINHFINILLPPQIAWFLFEFPNLFWILYFILTQQLELNIGFLCFVLFSIHYINRDIIYPLKISSNTKPIPLEIVLSAFIFTSFNGYLQVSTHFNQPYYETNLFLSIIGVVVFFFGMWANIQCDGILKQLKAKGKGYGIPEGNLFNLVSSGHYLGEIIEWFGFWLVSQQFSSFLFFFSTLNHLSARALMTHQWYQKNIKNYPQNRKAIIPWIL